MHIIMSEAHMHMYNLLYSALKFFPASLIELCQLKNLLVK